MHISSKLILRGGDNPHNIIIRFIYYREGQFGGGGGSESTFWPASESCRSLRLLISS